MRNAGLMTDAAMAAIVEAGCEARVEFAAAAGAVPAQPSVVP